MLWLTHHDGIAQTSQLRSLNGPDMEWVWSQEKPKSLNTLQHSMHVHIYIHTPTKDGMVTNTVPATLQNRTPTQV